jgi:Terminase large subunit, T4likevirus-type, N-terminal
MATTTQRREVAALRKEVDRLRATEATSPILDRLRQDPSRIFTDAQMIPDPWQTKLLRSSSDRMLLLCSRQSGKSLSAAALALREALLYPPALVLLLSPTQRQSGELFRDKVRRLYSQLQRPVACVQESQLTMELANGSRIISLPGDEETVRGYSGVNLLVIDEAARVPDALYYSVRPMLAVSQGRLVCLSTPFGQRGWFHSEWQGGEGWERTKITALQCPRISLEFLKEEERSLGPRWFAQEYLTSFEDPTDAVFSYADVQAARDDDVPPLFSTPGGS